MFFLLRQEGVPASYLSLICCWNLWKSMVSGFQSLVSFFQSTLGGLWSYLISLVLFGLLRGNDRVNLLLPAFFHLLYCCPLASFFHITVFPPQFSSVQFLSCVQLFVTPWTAACQASLSIINSQSLLKLMSIESVMPSNHLILCHPLLLLPSIFPSIRVFSNESTLQIKWPKYWSFRFSISPSNEYSGLISFRMDWLDLLAVQGTLKSLLQHHTSKVSILWHSAFFIVQLSHPYMTAGKTIALTRWTFVGK